MVFLVVVPVILLIIGGIHLYLWKRLVRDTLPRGRARRLAGFGVLVLAVLIPVSLIGERLVPQGARPLLAWPGYVWLGLMFYLLVTLALLEVPRLVLRLARRKKAVAPKPVPALVGAGASSGALAPDPPAATPPDLSRRLFLGRSLAAVAGTASVAATGIGMVQALGPPDLKRVSIPLAKLPASMDGFKIALVSDIHLGPLLGRAHTERIVRMINSANADAVAVVGDLVDGSVAELGEAAEPLQDLRARSTDWTSRASTTSPAGVTATGPTTPPPSTGATPAARWCCSRTSPCRRTRPPSTASTSNCPDTPTAGRWSRSTCSWGCSSRSSPGAARSTARRCT